MSLLFRDYKIMFDVSVIIPSWNAKSYLRDCIKSIYTETNNCRMEIIVVDNASTDGSPEMVKAHFPEIKLIRNKENLGFAKGCNIGMRQAKGKYVVIINSDVILGRECIDHMFKYMEEHSEIGVLGPKILGQDGMVQRSCMGFPTLWNSFCRALALDTMFPKLKLFGGQLITYWSHNTIRSVDIINGCFWMVRQEALKQVGLLDESFFMYSEDKDWCKRFTNAGWEVVFFPDAEAVHYGGASSSNAPIRFYIEMQRADLQYWKKHHSRIAWVGYMLITLFHHVVRILGQVITYVIKPSKSSQSGFKIKRSIACIQWLLKLNYNKL